MPDTSCGSELFDELARLVEISTTFDPGAIAIEPADAGLTQTEFSTDFAGHLALTRRAGERSGAASLR